MKTPLSRVTRKCQKHSICNFIFFFSKKRLKVMYKTINRKKEVRKKEENQDQTRPLYKINLFQENIRNLFIKIMLSIHQA